MIRVEINETIARPVEDVFEQLVDIPGYREWMPDTGLFLSCTKDSEGPVGLGTTYSDKTRLGTVRGEISAFERPRKVTFHYTAKLFGMTLMEGWPAYLLQRRDEATRLRHVAEGHLYGAFKLLQPVIQRIASLERRRTVDALKASLESKAG